MQTIDFSFLRRPAVLKARGTSYDKLYKDIREGLWTHPVPLGRRAVGWPLHEVQTLNAARIAGKTDDEIRELVAELEAERKTALEEALK